MSARVAPALEQHRGSVHAWAGADANHATSALQQPQPPSQPEAEQLASAADLVLPTTPSNGDAAASLPASKTEQQQEPVNLERDRGQILSRLSSFSSDAEKWPADAVNADAVNADKECPAAAAPTSPRSLLARVVSGSVSTLILSVVYIPFTMAILLQSAVTRQPVLPVNWEKELRSASWLWSFSLFGFMFVLPFVMVFGVLSDCGIWSLQSNDVTAAIPFTLCLALFLTLLAALHLCTVYYAYMRVDLREIHSSVHQFHISPSALLAIAAALFEAFQLISPWLTVQSLGLLGLSDASSDSNTFRGWLYHAGVVFGIGSWQVQGMNDYMPTFWLAFGIVVLYALALGYGIQSNMQPDHRAAGLLFEFIPGTLYLSIVGRLFSILNCDPDGSGGYVLHGDAAIVCWDNYAHRSMCLAALVALLCYSSSAMFVACYRGDATHSQTSVKYKPLYLVLERTMRDLYAITTSLITDGELSRCLSFPVLLLLLACTVRMQPCSVPSLGRLKVLSQSAAIWLLWVAFTADIARTAGSAYDAIVPGVLVFGWVLLCLVYLAVELLRLWQRRHRQRLRRHSISIAVTDEDDADPAAV